MTASTPHVIVPVVAPRDDRERAGRARARRTSGRVGAEHEVEHAAGAERDLGVGRAARSPGRRATPAGRRASAAIGGAPGERRGLADDAGSSRRSPAASRRGCASASSSVVVPARDGRRASRPVTAALVASVTCTAPFESVHATHVSTVPKHRSRRRPRSASCRAATAPWWPTGSGASRQPCARSARHAPTVRRSCQPMPGPTGSPVARSQTIVEPRWFEMPTPSTGPPSASAAAGQCRARRRAIAAASNSTSPSAGESGSSSRSCSCATVASASHDRAAHAARADVDDEDAHARSTPLEGWRGHGQTGASPDHGSARPSLPGLRMPFGSSASFTDGEHAESRRRAPRATKRAAVEADAVVVAERAAVRRAPRAAGVPRGAVVRLAVVGRRRCPRT